MEKTIGKIKSWRSRFLSHVGRIVLIKSILFLNIQVYWLSIFILLLKVHKEIENITKVFLWSRINLEKTKSKVAWRDICMSLNEGVLGIINTKEWNKATMVRHLWNIASRIEDSIWVQWVIRRYLRYNSLWAIKVPQDCPWIWRSILNLRKDIQKHILLDNRNGEGTYLWFDN